MNENLDEKNKDSASTLMKSAKEFVDKVEEMIEQYEEKVKWLDSQPTGAMTEEEVNAKHKDFVRKIKFYVIDSENALVGD